MSREQPHYNIPGDHCKFNLFFDGARNNYTASGTLERDKQIQSAHTNAPGLTRAFTA